MTAHSRLRPHRRWRAIGLLACCEVLALGLWFSAAAVIPALRTAGLSDLGASLFSSAVALGFVCGTLVSAVFGLADRLDPRRFFFASAMVAATVNALILTVEPTSSWVLLFRFVTGACVAGIYPVGMKMAATWARDDTGLVVGLLVGALTVGSATPHLFNASVDLDWRLTIALASASALAAGLLVNLVPLGPAQAKAPPFNPAYALQAWRDRPLRLANLGYFGHMWELYAMWAWIGVFLHASFLKSWADTASASIGASLASFAVIAIGGLGCLVGGAIADRMGRTTLTMAALAVSGCCCLLIGFLFAGPPWLLVSLAMVWGIAVVADSAQFSSCVIELSPPERIGTMVTVQTCIGFLLTLVTIHLLPYLVELVGWRYAFAPLAIGPALGFWAMARLRAHPQAVKLAGGNR